MEEEIDDVRSYDEGEKDNDDDNVMMINLEFRFSSHLCQLWLIRD